MERLLASLLDVAHTILQVLQGNTLTCDIQVGPPDCPPVGLGWEAFAVTSPSPGVNFIWWRRKRWA